jgi:hypothetical protein
MIPIVAPRIRGRVITSYHRRPMARKIIGIVLLLMGGVWFFQGIGVIGGSFMTDSPTWVVIGAVTAIAGGALILWRPKPPNR